MLRLLLLRHAKAAALAGGGDHARPLTSRGQDDARRLGGWLEASVGAPDTALVSDARRARETFDFLAACFTHPPTARLEPRLYNASATTMLALMRAGLSGARTQLLIGHNPGIAECALDLTGYGDRYAASRMRAQYATCGLAVLDFDIEAWAQLEPRAGRLDSFITPATLGGEDD